MIGRVQFLFTKFFSSATILKGGNREARKWPSAPLNKIARENGERTHRNGISDFESREFASKDRRSFDGYTLSIRLKGISVRHGSQAVHATFTQWLKEAKYQSIINNIAVFNTAIDLVSKGGHLRYSLDIGEEMLKRKIRPDGRTVCTLLSCLAQQMRKPIPPENHKETFALIMNKFWNGQKPEENLFVMNGVLRYHGGCDVAKLLQILPPNLNIYGMVNWKPDVISYSIVLESLSRSNRAELALIYHKVKPEDIVPDLLYYKALMQCIYTILYQYKPIDKEQLMCIIQTAQSQRYEYSNNSKSFHANILNCLRKLQEFKFAVEHFNTQILPFMDRGNLDQQIIAFHFRSLQTEGQSQAAFELFEKLKKQFSFKPELPALTSLMECCASQKSATKAEALFNGYVKKGIVVPGELLIKYYRKAIESSGLPMDEIQGRLKKLDIWRQEHKEPVHGE